MKSVLSAKNQEILTRTGIDLALKYDKAKEIDSQLTPQEFLVKEITALGDSPVTARATVEKLEQGRQNFKKLYDGLSTAPSAVDYQISYWRNLMHEKGYSPVEQAQFLVRGKQYCLALCSERLKNLQAGEDDSPLRRAIGEAKAAAKRILAEPEPSAQQIETLLEEFVDICGYVDIDIGWREALANISASPHGKPVVLRFLKTSATKALDEQDLSRLGAYAVYACVRRGDIPQEEMQMEVFGGSEEQIGFAAAAAAERANIEQQVRQGKMDYETGYMALAIVSAALLIAAFFILPIVGWALVAEELLLLILVLSSYMSIGALVEAIAEDPPKLSAETLEKLNNNRRLQHLKNRFVIAVGRSLNKASEALGGEKEKIAGTAKAHA